MRNRSFLQEIRAEDGDAQAEINTTPLIDVMLVLLIMLIVTIPIQTHAVNLSLSGAVQDRGEPRLIRLEIAADGTARLAGRLLLDQGALELALRDLRDGPQLPVLQIAPAGQVKYGQVVKVMAAAQRLGFERVTLAE